MAGIMVAILSTLSVYGQSTQTIRGRVVDNITEGPLTGVSVRVQLEGTAVLGSVSDVDGFFRIDNVPLGRQTVIVTMIGYEEQQIPNVIVTAGKEVILNLRLTERMSELDAVEVVADSRDDKTATNNDLAVVSARSFNVDDTKRYAGALGDPSRMAANFAGVVGGDDSRNDIVVRGNSPSGMLWQLEGLNIPNPNHFGSLFNTGGPVSMLNNNNLDKSDFLTSAFPSQYGNAVAGVFDIRLRDGNNEKREFLAQAGFAGFELGAEGPFSSSSKASFIVNYRYSTLGVFQALGIDFGTGSNTPLYQDLNFKISIPSGARSKWTIFGLGGTSSIDLLGSEADLKADDDLYGSENEDSYPRYKTAITGVSYETNLSEKTFAKWTAGLSYTSEQFNSDSLQRDNEDDVIGRFRRAEGDMTTTKLSLNFLTRTRLNARNSITSGFYIDASAFDLFNRDLYANLNRDSVRVNVDERATLYQFFSTWKHRFSQKLSLQTGVHGQYYSLNDQFVLEPRVSAQYVFDAKHTLSAGYGVHHQTQNIYTSFGQTNTPDGPVLTNTDLKFTRSNHFALTYDWYLSDNLRLKAETYYQSLSDVPVEQALTSFSAINTGASFAPTDQDSLVNKGTGKNYGVELTLERFFNNGYFFLLTTSLFDSKYKGSDGVERNTAYNTRYVVNLLGGKEWRVGRKNNYFSLSVKLTSIGGKYLTPIDFAASQQYGRAIYQEGNAFSERQDPYFRTDLKISYRREYAKSTLEFALDLQNVTNNQNIFAQTYNARTNSIATQYQQGLFIVPFIRYTF